MTITRQITIGYNHPCYKRKWGIRLFKPARLHGVHIHLGRYAIHLGGLAGPSIDYACPGRALFGCIRWGFDPEFKPSWFKTKKERQS